MIARLEEWLGQTTIKMYAHHIFGKKYVGQRTDANLEQ